MVGNSSVLAMPEKNDNISGFEAGFTLIELMIVISIILFLSPMVITNYNAGERRFSLERSAHGLAQDLRDAEEMALTGEETPASFDKSFPAGGYGLYFEANQDSYVLFADCDGDGSYDASGVASSCSSASSAPGESYPEKIKEFSMESGVVISDLYPSTPLAVLFFPPQPIITLNPIPGNMEAVITLELDGRTKTVSINTAGLIDVD